jgi:hypothetical protein
MRNFRSNTSGQFVIIAALLIAVLTLSVAASIHQMSSNRIQLEYKPLDELVLGITSDLERALTYALSNASKQYYATGDIRVAQNAGNLSLLRWQRSVLAAYPQLGIDLNFPEAASFTFQWNNPADNSGLSHADLPNYEFDVGAYGFRGWTGHSEKYVSLRINEFTYNNADYSTVNFQITQFVNPGSIAAPIPNLTADDVTVWTNVSGSALLKGIPYDPQYVGEGNYTLVFKNPLPGLHPRAVTLVVSTPEDQILVSATATSSVSVALQSQMKNSAAPDQSNPHIQIKLGNVTYPLPQNITDWGSLQPYLSCISDGMSYVFLNWTATGDINIANPYENETNVMANGNGTITVFYDILRSISSAFNLTVTSKLDGTGTYTNIGYIVFDSGSYNLAFNQLMTTATHSIAYYPAAGYTFARWEFSPTSPQWISLSNDHSSSTGMMLFGNGTLTAVYQSRKILLDSEEYNGTTAHLGNINLGGYTYGIASPLPAILYATNATVSNGVYVLSFTPSNSSYKFLWWDISGDVILMGGNQSITSIEILGNGNITAIYQLIGNGPPPSSGGVLWVDAHGSKDFWLVPTIPTKDGHLASKASTGSGKANLTITSDPTVSQIHVASIVSVTAYIGIQPANSPLRILEFELGFNYNGSYYRLGYDKFVISSTPNAVYNMYMDTTSDVFPGDHGVIPQGSTITLSVTATFTTPPGGTIFLFYGPSQPSSVTLFT